MSQLQDAELLCIRCMQRDYYSALYWHIVNLKGTSCVARKKEFCVLFIPLRKLNVFCDKDLIMHIHIHIINSGETYDRRFPILLPHKRHFVEILIRKYHLKSNHFGRSFMLAQLQMRYWIIHGQSTVRHYRKNREGKK